MVVVHPFGVARAGQQYELLRLSRTAMELDRLLERVQPVVGTVDEEERARRELRDDGFRLEREERRGRLERDLAAEARVALELIVCVHARDAVERQDVERGNELGLRAGAVGLDARQEAGPALRVVCGLGRAPAVSYRVQRGHRAHPRLRCGRGDYDAAAKTPADERDAGRVDLGDGRQEVHRGDRVLDLLLREEATWPALALSE